MDKKRIIFLSTIFILIVIASLVATYALDVGVTENTTTDYDLSYTFDIYSNTQKQVTIAAGKTKVFDIDITNPQTDSVKYGVAYSMVSPTTLPDGVTIAQSSASVNTSVGLVDANGTATISIVVKNDSASDVTIQLSIINGYKNGGDLVIPDGANLIKYIYLFNPDSLAEETLLNLELAVSINEEIAFSVASNISGTTGVYSAEDDLGISYYFRGDITNNYVKFGSYSNNVYSVITLDENTGIEIASYATTCPETYVECYQMASIGDDMYWRIIRVNGDGSIRMIYDGVQVYENNSSSKKNYIGATPYNNSLYNDNTYVGYMNGTIDGTYFKSGNVNSTSYDEAHINITNSTIKQYIDDWYESNMANTSFSNYVVDAIYCNDRSLSTSTTGTGFGTSATEYGALYRVYNNSSPTLKCSQENDMFTVDEKLGNGDLTYPIGLITADEVMYAGMVIGTDNNNNYLKGTSSLTMSPSYFGNNHQIFTFGSSIIPDSGTLNNDYKFVIRPVISISPDAIQYGTGISTDPFRLTSAI